MTDSDGKNAYVRELGRRARQAGVGNRITATEPPEAPRLTPQEQFAQVRLAREQKRAAAAAGGDVGEQTAGTPPPTMNELLRGQLAASKAPEQQP